MTASSVVISDGHVRGEGLPPGLMLDDLRWIINHDEDDDLPGYLIVETSVVVHLSGGGRVWAKKATIADEKIKIEWQSGPPLDLSIDLLRGLDLDVRADSRNFEKKLAAPPATLDRVLVENEDGSISTVSGLVESLSENNLMFDVNKQKRSLPRTKIHGIVFAQPAPATIQPRVTAKFRDHSQLAGDTLSVTDGKAALSIGLQAVAQFDWSSIYEIAIRSTRLVYLSDWPSINEQQTPIVTLPFPAQRDKNVSGGRLQVGPQFFEKGLGVHARSAITFATESKWDTFVAKIGLDAQSSRKGDCVFKVLADGKPIFEKRKQDDGLFAEDVRVPITGCQELTLLVEPGDGLDLADHANWCDARLIKNKPPAK